MYCDLSSQYIQVRKLFKGGNYSRVETIRGNTIPTRRFAQRCIGQILLLLDANRGLTGYPLIQPHHSYFFLHIERSFWCFADLVTIFERFREYSKIVPLMVSQSSLLFSWLNFCRLAHTSTTEKSLENAALLLQ